jgi:4-carboxymuconolactone decarboxylase
MTDRQSNREAGALHRRVLHQADDDPGLGVPSYRDYVDDFYHGTVGARDVLVMEDRLIPALTAVCYRGEKKAIARLVGAALDAGLEPRSVVEVFIQSALYGGLPHTEQAIEIANDVFSKHKIVLANDPPDTRTSEQLDKEGAAVMEKLHGKRQAGGYASPDDPITFALYQGAIRHGYGNLWIRPGLDIRQRMICAIAGFSMLGLHDSLRKFCVSALNVGLSKRQVAEAAIQTAPWNSLPVAMTALATISAALAEMD